MIRRFIWSEGGTASVEFALIVPLLVVLLFGGSEAGHFVWTQHKLTEAVRDGARYASRLPFETVCDGATDVLTNGDHDAEHAQVIAITRTGQLGSASVRPVVPGWTDAQVDVIVSCESFVNTGLYAELGANGPIVTVAATNVNYPSLFGVLGRITRGVSLNARSSAAVIGI